MDYNRATTDGAGERFPAGWNCSQCGLFLENEPDDPSEYNPDLDSNFGNRGAGLTESL